MTADLSSTLENTWQKKFKIWSKTHEFELKTLQCANLTTLNCLALVYLQERKLVCTIEKVKEILESPLAAKDKQGGEGVGWKCWHGGC